jgi:hypothetical protein
MIRASGDTCRPSTWPARPGRWLLGVVLVYGLLPRLLLAALCLWRWRQGRGRLALDLNLPGYAQLREALMPRSERIGVRTRPRKHSRSRGGQLDSGSSGALLVAWTGRSAPWPPACRKREQRRRARQPRIAQQTARTTRPLPPARLAIACDPRRSPDRGSLALIAELARNASATRIWLLQPPRPGAGRRAPGRLARRARPPGPAVRRLRAAELAGAWP